MHFFYWVLFLFNISFLATQPSLFAPVITAPSILKVNYYTEAVIVCDVTGYPTPDIKWEYKQVCYIFQHIIIFIMCMGYIKFQTYRRSRFLVLFRMHVILWVFVVYLNMYPKRFVRLKYRNISLLIVKYVIEYFLV